MFSSFFSYFLALKYKYSQHFVLRHHQPVLVQVCLSRYAENSLIITQGQWMCSISLVEVHCETRESDNGPACIATRVTMAYNLFC
jgi:hypothetical protein